MTNIVFSLGEHFTPGEGGGGEEGGGGHRQQELRVQRHQSCQVGTI